MFPLAAFLLLVVMEVPALLSGQQPAPPKGQQCVDCHLKNSPQLVADWRASKHFEAGIGCETCHPAEHIADADKGVLVKRGNALPTPELCAQCHADRVEQFKKGKHAMAWTAMKAMPTAHMLPATLSDGMKGCGGCHKIGTKTDAEIRELRKTGVGYGVASCDACHTRHTFSVAEARQPEACKTCHMGFDHAQWEMYSSSKHGVRQQLRQMKVLPEEAAAPTCQTCHMPGGDHGVRTAWGFLAVRLPMPEDKQWAEDRTVILQALGVLDASGKPTARLDTVKAADLARLTQESWQQERDAMQKACASCHVQSFAKAELAKGDDMIRQADRLMAKAIRTVAALYADGILKKPSANASPYPDLLEFHDAPTQIEQKLFVMFLEHRMRAFQGTFHASPDYALWYGWSELKRDVTQIADMAQELRRNARVSTAAGNR
ncbi:MAG TPA: multiheme c-type cytochrome [Vicinamibacterales bacterium]|nr:multiheme c-type cytochrome [Vicinamibacterales bacterium]HPW19325.1 multiheme c-type cytochrome [Vicinamibacterales bacterium]